MLPSCRKWGGEGGMSVSEKGLGRAGPTPPIIVNLVANISFKLGYFEFGWISDISAGQSLAHRAFCFLLPMSGTPCPENGRRGPSSPTLNVVKSELPFRTHGNFQPFFCSNQRLGLRPTINVDRLLEQYSLSEKSREGAGSIPGRAFEPRAQPDPPMLLLDREYI